MSARSRCSLFPEHTLNLRHVIMAHQISLAIVPRNRNLAPRSCYNRTKVIRRGAIAPANTVAGLEASGLIASHRRVSSGMRPFKRVLGQQAMPLTARQPRPWPRSRWPPSPIVLRMLDGLVRSKAPLLIQVSHSHRKGYLCAGHCSSRPPANAPALYPSIRRPFRCRSIAGRPCRLAVPHVGRRSTLSVVTIPIAIPLVRRIQNQGFICTRGRVLCGRSLPQNGK
jgi:hypothetical protein